MSAIAPSNNKRPFRMKAGISTLSDLADGSAALGGVLAAGGDHYYCDPKNGSDGNDGLSAQTAKASLETAYAMTTADQNDVVFFVGGATAFAPTAAFDWANDYTHLIGLSVPVPGQGARCRVVAAAATALTQVMTISGDGCVISNMQFNNEKASGACGSLTLTGNRLFLNNCFIMNPTSLTAAGWALKVAGEECAFVNCSIGQCSSNVRTLATYGAWLHTDANSCKFIGCEFKSWSDTTTHDLVFIDAITGEGWSVQFEDCLFQNLGNGTLAAAIDDNHAEGYHQVLFRGRNNLFVKCTAVSTVLGSTYAPDMNGDHVTSGMIAINVTET